MPGRQSRFRQAGFAVVEFIVIVLIVIGLIAVGLWVLNERSNDTKDKDTTSNTAQASNDDDANIPEAPAIDDTNDLDAAEQALEGSDIEANTNDAAELEGELQNF